RSFMPTRPGPMPRFRFWPLSPDWWFTWKSRPNGFLNWVSNPATRFMFRRGRCACLSKTMRFEQGEEFPTMSQMTVAGDRADELPAPDRNLDSALKQVAHALQGLQFGTVTIIVQDGIPIQVERTEKRRLRSPGRKE